MFKIGEFSQIARVSIRQLRFYDETGLIRPAYVEPSSGYRYYKAEQLPRLNKILALKNLGLSLDEISGILDRESDVSRIRTLLESKRSEVTDRIAEEEARFREIEARLELIEDSGTLEDYDLILKPGLDQWTISVDAVFGSIFDSFPVIQMLGERLKRLAPADTVQNVIVQYGAEGFAMENVRLELGYLLTEPLDLSIDIPNAGQATVRKLKDPGDMITLVRSGSPEVVHHSTYAMGRWIETRGLNVAGKGREVILVLSDPSVAPPVIEMQFPVMPVK